MKKILGIIQEHMFSEEEIKRFEEGLRRIYKNNYSDEKVSVIWMVMPDGYAYSERKPSHAVVMMMEVEESITQENREKLLFAVSKFLMNNFNISPLDSVITAPNSSYVNAFLEAQQKRIDAKYRPFVNLKILGKAFWSKITKGFTRLPVKV